MKRRWISPHSFSHNRSKPISILQTRCLHFVVKRTVNYLRSIFLRSNFNLTSEFFHLAWNRHRSQINSLVHRIPNHSLSIDYVEKTVFELIVHALLHNEALGIKASLCVAIQATSICSLRRLFQVSLFKHHESIVAPKLERTFLHMFTADFSYLLAALSAPRKLNGSDSGIFDDLVHCIVVSVQIRKLWLVKTPTQWVRSNHKLTYASKNASSSASAH